jgi:hypothetical protein
MSGNCIGYLDDESGQKITFFSNFKEDFIIEMIELDQISSPADILNIISAKNIELIVLDYKLDSNGKSFNADKVVEIIINWNPYFPILVLTSHEKDAFAGLDNVNIINSKIDWSSSLESKELFVLKIEENIKNYKNKILKAQMRINDLVNKKLSESFSLLEEEEYFRLFRFLDEVFPSEKLLPANIQTPETISRLHNLLLSAREILVKIKEK